MSTDTLPSEYNLDQPRVTYEKIKNAQAVILDNVPLDPQVARELTFPDSQLSKQKFTYINLVPQDDEEIISAEKMLSPMYGKKYQPEIFPEKTNLDYDPVEDWSYFATKPDNESDQHEMMNELIDAVFRDRQNIPAHQKLYEEFLKAVSEKPDLPFLVIDAHGATELPWVGRWFLGSDSGFAATPIRNVFRRFKDQRFSAVLIHACNDGMVRPPRIDGTPIFYSFGDVNGRGSLSRTRKRE